MGSGERDAKAGDYHSAAENKPAEGLSDEASKLLVEKKAKEELIKESANRLETPGLNAMAARSVYYGLQGRLWPNMGQITNVMLQSGPIGEAAVARMHALSGKGWTFGALTPADPYIASQAKSVAGRIAFSAVVGGYNDAATGRITHNPLSSMINTVMGISNGADLDAANKYIHETAHGKYSQGFLKHEGTAEARSAFQKLPEEVRRVHGANMVQEELRALTAQVVSNARYQGDYRAFLTPQTKGLANYPIEAALKQGEIGGLIKDVWMYEGNKQLSKPQANAAANEYLKANYGQVFDGNRINPKAELAIAAEISRLPVEAPSSLKTGLAAAGTETAFQAPRYFNYLSRGAQGLGSLMVLTAVADLNRQFKISTSAGLSRVSSVGADWAGFEAGAAMGGWFGEGLARSLVKTNPRLAMLALPLCAIGTGLVTSQITHETISKPLEYNVHKTLDRLLQE